MNLKIAQASCCCINLDDTHSAKSKVLLKQLLKQCKVESFRKSPCICSYVNFCIKLSLLKIIRRRIVKKKLQGFILYFNRMSWQKWHKKIFLDLFHFKKKENLVRLFFGKIAGHLMDNKYATYLIAVCLDFSFYKKNIISYIYNKMQTKMFD